MVGCRKSSPRASSPASRTTTFPGPGLPTRPPPARPRIVRGKALIFWDPKDPGQEARRDRHRPDHARGRLRLGEPRDARRALEGRVLPPPDARLPAARPPRRDVSRRGRALRDRLLPRDEPGGPEGRRRGEGPRARRRLQPRHGRHLPPQRVQPRPPRRAVPRGGRRRAGRRRVRLRSGDAALDQRDAGQDLRARPAVSEGGGDPLERGHLRRGTPRVPRLGFAAARRSAGRSPTSRAG